MMIYVASSWRNELYPEVVDALRDDGHDVYDFRNPDEGDQGFHWSEIDPAWKDWDANAYRRALQHPIAQSGLVKDAQALKAAEAVVLVTPCGPSAHLELGHGIGAGKITAVLVNWEHQVCYEGAGFQLFRRGEPELMYGLADAVCTYIGEVTNALRHFAAEGEQDEQ